MVRFDFNFFVNCIFEIIFKVPYTLYLGCVSFALSIFIAIMLVALRGSKIAPVRGLAGLYISFFRSTPYITQLFIFYYGLPQIFFSLRSISAETAVRICLIEKGCFDMTWIHRRDIDLKR